MNVVRTQVLALTIVFLLCARVVHAAPGDQITKLTATGLEGTARFGVGTSISGNRALVGTEHPDPGSAYIFDVPSGEQLFKLIPSGSAENDRFGVHVSIHESIALVGAPGVDNFRGAAYVFDVATGAELFKLSASDGASNDVFGVSTAVYGNLALVGARQKNSSRGAAYLFDLTTGMELRKLTGSDVMVNDEFGRDVATDGNVALVGASSNTAGRPGAVYVFDVATGDELLKLTPDDSQDHDGFGNGVEISGNIAVVGAPLHGDFDAGTAYLFDITSGQQLFKLNNPSGFDNEFFGNVVSIDGDLAAVGATGGVVNGTDRGFVSIFDVLTGQELFQLTASDGEGFDQFGVVSISGSVAVVGAMRHVDSTLPYDGAAYLFTLAEELVGDYNNDGAVNAADYTVWRDTLGATGTDLVADGNDDEVVDIDDYELWKQYFGQSASASGSNILTTVPEPSIGFLAAIAFAVVFCYRFQLSHGNSAE